MPINPKESTEKIYQRKRFLQNAENIKTEMRMRVIRFFEKNRYTEYTPREIVEKMGLASGSVEEEAACSVLCDFRSNFHNKENVVWLPAIDGKPERYYMG